MAKEIIKLLDFKKKPFFCLAPMANITTYPFAYQCIKYGADIVWTPMVHTDTVINNWEASRKIIDFMDIDNYIIQLVGSGSKDFEKAIKTIEKNKIKPLAFDINTGCPDKNILKSGCGGELLKNTKKITEIVKSAKESTNTPISIKTRSGYQDGEYVYSLVPRLIDLGVDLITIHPRTVIQRYSGKADWSVVKNVKSKMTSEKCILVGSGDVKAWQEAYINQEYVKCEGIMIGRGTLGKPWIFKEIKEKKDYFPDKDEIKSIAIDISEKTEKIWGDRGIIEARKHYGWLFRGFLGAKETRHKLMSATNLEEVKKILH